MSDHSRPSLQNMQPCKFTQIAIGQYTKDGGKGIGSLVYALGEDGNVYQHRHTSGGWQLVDSSNGSYPNGQVVSMPRTAKQAQRNARGVSPDNVNSEEAPW